MTRAGSTQGRRRRAGVRSAAAVARTRPRSGRGPPSRHPRLDRRVQHLEPLCIPPPQSDHPFRRHPEWLTRSAGGATWDGANYAFDPGHPGVQQHTFDVALDLVRRYDLDGLHWDYVRYAGKDWGYNVVAVRRFNARHGRTGKPASTDPDWLQFRRDQVTALVRKVYLAALAEKPALKISAATITFAPGISDTAQWPRSAAYSDVLQDWRAWMEEGILDWNLPMTYFRQTEHPRLTRTGTPS